MPISISQRPAPYNLVVSPNVYTLQGLDTQEAYVLRVENYDETTASSTPIATIQQPANPAGVAHFDIAKILQSYMDIKFVEDLEQATTTDGTSFQYRVRFGGVVNNVPQWVGTYDTQINTAFNGYSNWREMNWPEQTNFIPTPDPILCEVGQDTNADFREASQYLHNYPSTSIPLRSSTYHTLSFMNRIGNWNNGTDWQQNTQPYAVRIQFYDIGGNLIQTAAYPLSGQDSGLGPRYDHTSVPGAYTDAQLVGTIGAGPQNLKDAGYWPQSSAAIWNQVSQVWGNYAVIWNLATATSIVDHYTVDVMSIDQCKFDVDGPPATPNAADIIPYLDHVIYSEDFQVDAPCTGYEPITVSFLNQYGVKDYFTFDRRNTYNQSIKRNNYDQQLGSWSAATYEIDQHGRGRRTFNTAIQTKMTMNSYWMGDAESAWLEELFTSPHIQVYYNGVWEPAVITSNSYQQKTNTRDGLFQHTLNIEFANTKKVQRG